jgi:hypothetical protein
MMNKIKFVLLAIASLTVFACTQKPYFEMRGVVLGVNDLETLDWPKLAYENGINTIGTHIRPLQVAEFIRSEKGKKFLADCEKYGICVEHQLHAMGELLPRELFAQDSTMFRMNEEGKRVSDCNFCVHSQKALDIVAGNALHYTRLLPSGNHRYYYWMDDYAPVCVCRECSGYSASDQALIVENRIIRELRKHDPEAQLAHLAYGPTYAAPHRVKPEEGIFLEFAPINYRSWEKPFAEEQGEAKELMQHLKDNLTVFPVETAVILEYWLDESQFMRMERAKGEKGKFVNGRVKLPWTKEVFESDLDTYASLGIRNVTTFAVYFDDKYLEVYSTDIQFLKEYGEGLKKSYK